jgi:hypothetical protein
MTNDEIKEARAKLGAMWKPGGGMARALGLSEDHGDDHVYNMERGKTAASGTVVMLIRTYLGGAVPPDDVVIFDRK